MQILTEVFSEKTQQLQTFKDLVKFFQSGQDDSVVLSDLLVKFATAKYWQGVDDGADRAPADYKN